MPLELRHVKSDSEFNELVQCECESYEDPFNGFYLLLRPDRGSSPKGREGFKELRDRQIAWHKHDPTSTWLKVVDTDIGDKVVGGACWNTFLENPYSQPMEHPLEATWWPEGEPREFANKLLDDWLQHRSRKMNRPHMLVALCFVHPEHRRRGVASMLLRWGTEKADELGLEAFVESTDDGKACYEQHGFIYMNTFYMDSAKRDPSKKWVEMGNYLKTPVHCYLMWRPRGGKFEEGKTVVPRDNGYYKNW